MDDKTMLELAAKACGIDHWYGKEGTVDWNPLTDDGDALRLACKLLLIIDIGATMVSVQVPDGHMSCVTADEVADAYAATRLAIVRAAAEIGRKM